MTKPTSFDTAALAKQAQNSKEKEAYQQLEKTQTYRIGVGARANPPAPSFFVEIIINLSTENGEVDLQHLEKTLKCLKALKARRYTLTYEDGNCISCETSTAIQSPHEEYLVIKALMQQAHL